MNEPAPVPVSNKHLASTFKPVSFVVFLKTPFSSIFNLLKKGNSRNKSMK